MLHRNADVEAEIGQLRAQLLHKDQENERVQLQLQEEKEERERAQRKVPPCAGAESPVHLQLLGQCCDHSKVSPTCSRLQNLRACDMNARAGFSPHPNTR